MINPQIRDRLDELIREGEQLWREFQQTNQKAGVGTVKDPVRFTQWVTSCLNLLDHLSISTNRFVAEYERWSGGVKTAMNIGAALGVLKSARTEYERGFAIDYHLSVASAVFGDLLSQAEYLLEKGYTRASAVLVGAALEEALKSRAKAIPLEISKNDTLVPLLHKLKTPDIGVITELQSKNLEAVAKIRNDAAHGGAFDYTKADVRRALEDVRATLGRILGER